MKIATIINGIQQLIEPIITSRGSEDGRKPIQTTDEGFVDDSLFPPGIGQDIITRPATEAIAAGAPVNLYDDAGTPSMRNADASSPAKQANGFVKSAIASGASGKVYAGGFVGGLDGLSSGSRYYLAASAGQFTAVPLDPDDPANAGRIHQFVGTAVSEDTLLFRPADPIRFPAA